MMHIVFGLEVFYISKQRNKIFDTEANIYYARYYSNLPFSAQRTWWFSTIDYTLLSQQELINCYGYNSVQQIQQSENYLPFVRVDILSLELGYLQRYYPKEIKYVNKDNLDASFKQMIERFNGVSHWHAYEEDVLHKAIIQWCKENRIVYV